MSQYIIFPLFQCPERGDDLAPVANSIENNKTYQAILPFVSQQIQLVNYPYKTGNKASQINYFIEQSNNSSLEESNSYYAIFDADSRPDFRAFY